MIPNICIFTPTYNRGYKLPDLYKSLLAQASRNFYWLIVDDGSTDNTKEIVSEWAKLGEIEIEYVFQNNGGKQRAINTGAELCRSELFCCVDSDDTLSPDAVKALRDAWESRSDDPRIAGIATPMMKRNNLFPTTGIYRLCDLYQSCGYRGETLIATKADVVRRYPFVVDPNEKFVPELYQFDQIDQNYVHIALNMELCESAYLSDGYSHSYGKLLLRNPRSYAEYKRQCISFSKSLFTRVRECLLYLGWCRIGKIEKTEALSRVPDSLVCKTLYPFSAIMQKAIEVSLERKSS